MKSSEKRVDWRVVVMSIISLLAVTLTRSWYSAVMRIGIVKFWLT